VFANVAWTGRTREHGALSDGEADLVIAHPDRFTNQAAPLSTSRTDEQLGARGEDLATRPGLIRSDDFAPDPLLNKCFRWDYVPMFPASAS
jgi:hypothetical protein